MLKFSPNSKPFFEKGRAYYQIPFFPMITDILILFTLKLYYISSISKHILRKFHFASFNSHRAQLGSVFEYAYTADLRPYIALTYEYTFKADAKGRAADQYGDLALDRTDLEGSTGIVSLGWTYQNEARDFEFDAGMNGYAGKRRGISAQLQAAWKF